MRGTGQARGGRARADAVLMLVRQRETGAYRRRIVEIPHRVSHVYGGRYRPNLPVADE